MPDELFPPIINSMMITRSLKFLLTATLLTTTCAFSSTALAEDLTLYSNVVKPVDVPNTAKDIGVGHRRIRESKIRLSEKGKVVGKSYSISNVVKANAKAGTRTGAVLGVVQLPKGTFWTEATAEVMNLKAAPGAGYKYSGIILGGTGAYQGVTGTFDFEYSKDGKFTTRVCHFVRAEK